jgi:hypothetical protein
MNILKDINNNPLTIGKCYKNIGQYVKKTLRINDNTYLGKLNEIEGIYGLDDPGRNKIYIFENNNKLDEYFIKKQNIKLKEVSCDDFHTELPRYSSNESQLSLTQPPAYEEPIKYEPPPSYEKKTFGNTLSNTFGKFARLTRGTSPPYTESGGKKNKTKIKRKNTRKSKKLTRKNRKRARKH